MAEVTILGNKVQVGDVIYVDGTCYEVATPTADAVTHNQVAGIYEDCDLCIDGQSNVCHFSESTPPDVVTYESCDPPIPGRLYLTILTATGAFVDLLGYVVELVHSANPADGVWYGGGATLSNITVELAANVPGGSTWNLEIGLTTGGILGIPALVSDPCTPVGEYTCDAGMCTVDDQITAVVSAYPGACGRI